MKILPSPKGKKSDARGEPPYLSSPLSIPVNLFDKVPHTFHVERFLVRMSAAGSLELQLMWSYVLIPKETGFVV